MSTQIDTATIRALIEAATRAPSSHNTQPWMFEPRDGAIVLYADRTRALPVNDPWDRELTISCGAALRNLEIAAAHRGLAASVSLVPDDGDDDLLAHVSLVPAETGPAVDHDDAALYDAIDRRHTTRDAFEDEPAPDGLGPRLIDVAARHGAILHLVGPDDRAPISTLVSEGDRIQFADPRWRRELASWMHPRRRGDGLVVGEVVGLVTRTAVRAVDLGESTAGTDVELIERAPLLGVLATGDDDARTWLDTGRALEDVVLTAAAEGLAAGHLNQPCQVEGLRGRLQALLPRRHPQILLCLGRPVKPLAASPRRPVDDVIVGADST